MSFPDDKETWDTRETDDLIVKEDHNNWARFLERLQDTLGIGIKLGYGSVKFLLDYLKSKADLVDGKVSKAGDTMTGDLTLDKSANDSPMIIFKSTGLAEGKNKLGVVDNNGLLIYGKVHIAMFANENQIMYSEGNFFTLLKPLSMGNNEIVEVKYLETSEDGYIDMTSGNQYIRIETPDHTKIYRISINDAGNVITTLEV